MVGRTNTGGGGSGATLTIIGVAGATVTASKNGKTYTRTINNSGTAVFKGLSTGTWTVTMSSDGQTATRTVEITADYSLKIAYFSATITITYPANSTCVVTDSIGATIASNTNTGTDTKTWTATVNATGTYTITATSTIDSSKTKSTTISIATDGQSESVTLVYNIDALLAYTWKALSAHGSSYSLTPATIGNHVMTLSATYKDSNNQGNVRCGPQDKIDFTHIDTVTVVVDSCNIGNSNYPCTIGLVDSYVSTDPTYLAKYDITSSISSPKDASIDVSKITGEHYLIVQNRSSYDPVVTVTIKISKMILS